MVNSEPPVTIVAEPVEPHIAQEWAPVPLSAMMVGQRRMEGESYLTPGYAARMSLLNSGAKLATISDVARVWQPGRLKGIQVSRHHGEPFLTATQVFDIRPRPRKWLAADATPDID